MKEYANTGCSSIPLLLCDLYGDKQMSQPSRAILCAYVVGLTCASIATNFSKTHF
ncbi:3-oxoacyl-[acyl-carrier-protein] synthase III C-terminal domain-containing protein, partial [Phocaeicola vulgatus]|uniref:3-oxoacyl-[acyl-carrier-protein] synthase III C-terminal domain-containing protein n=1 Tax=Phocaeicola vulgatus TaxID=821 RepID=UPI0034E8AE03